LKTPDITPAQLVAAFSAVVGLVLTARYIDDRLAQLLVGVGAIVIPIAWTLADALIRRGRSNVVAAQAHADALRAINSPAASPTLKVPSAKKTTKK
jgi:hypothetical protein